MRYRKHKQSKISNMKIKANLLILLTVVTVILTSCGASRKAGCDAYGQTKVVNTGDLASK